MILDDFDPILREVGDDSLVDDHQIRALSAMGQRRGMALEHHDRVADVDETEQVAEERDGEGWGSREYLILACWRSTRCDGFSGQASVQVSQI
jgi:hypothetical protein